MTFISPQPNTWYKIWLDLKAKWEQEKMTCSPPPVALVLSGWTMSNDYDKQERWQQTLRWADRNQMTELIPELQDDEKYFVETPSSWRPFEDHDYTNHPAKYKPTKEEIEKAIDTLKRNWRTYLGDTFAEQTKPLKLTGDKSRRLLVKVQSNYEPPWGTWTKIDENQKILFSNFRRQINSDIAPIEIDHIDFVFKEQ